MNVALYIRVSTDDQLEFSPDAQKRALTEYAKKNGYAIDENYIFIDEGISGTSAKKRPAFMRMIATAKSKPKPFDAILVHKFDRFARSREDSVVYKSLLRKECDIKVISITEQLEDDKFSVILEAMLEAMAEYYSLNLSDEVMKGMTEKARRGGVQSSPVLGYDIIDNKYVVNENEAKLVKMAFEKYLNGESFRDIASYFNLIGATNKRGNRFQNRIIKYMLQNPVYYGMVRWNYATQKGKGRKINNENEWIIAKGVHDPLVSEEMFFSVQEKISASAKHYTRKPGTEYKHWLGGLLRCSRCGGTLTYFGYSKSSLTPNSKYTGYFACNKHNKGSCDTKNNISVKNAEYEVKNLLLRVNELLQEEGEINLNIEVKTSIDISLLESQLEKLNRRMEMAKKAYLAEVDSLDEYKNNKKTIQQEIDAVKKEINSCEDFCNVRNELSKKVSSAIDILDDKDISIKTKNDVLKEFISSIVYDRVLDTLEINLYYNS